MPPLRPGKGQDEMDYPPKSRLTVYQRWARDEEPFPNMMRSVELDPGEKVVRLSVQDPAYDSTWDRVHEVMRELDDEIYRRELLDKFGDDTRLEIVSSDLFSICPSCRHVKLASSPCSCGEA